MICFGSYVIWTASASIHNQSSATIPKTIISLPSQKREGKHTSSSTRTRILITRLVLRASNIPRAHLVQSPTLELLAEHVLNAPKTTRGDRGILAALRPDEALGEAAAQTGGAAAGDGGHGSAAEEIGEASEEGGHRERHEEDEDWCYKG